MKYRKLVSYAGGQTHLLSLLLELMPRHKTYVEVFAGGATLFWNKQPSDAEVINDIDRRLVDVLEVVKDEPDEFKRQLSLLPNSRELFNSFKVKIRSEPDKIKRAVMYYYLLLNTWSGRSKADTYVSKSRNTAKIEQIGWFSQRLRHVTIENLDCVDLIEKYKKPGTFFFNDPPYHVVGNTLYEHHFKDKDHIRLAVALRNLDEINSTFLLTYNNTPLIQLLYRDFPQFVCETPRTMALVKKNPKEQHLIIANYDIVTRKFKPFTSTYARL